MLFRKRAHFNIVLYFCVCWLCAAAPQISDAAYTVTIQPIVTVSEEYTDNLFLSEDDKEHEFITIVSPGILIQAKEQTSEFSLLYEAGYSSYARNGEYDSWRHLSEFKGFFRFGRHTELSFRNTFLLTEEPTGRLRELFDEEDAPPPIDDTPIVETETVRRRREKYYRDTANIALVHQYGVNDQISFIYDYDILNNQDQRVRDRERHRPAAEIRHWLIPNELGLQGLVRYSREDVEDSTDEFGYYEESIHPSLFFTYWVNPKQFRLKTGLSYEYGEYREEDPAIGEEFENTYYVINPLMEWSYLFRPQKILLDGLVGYEKGNNNVDDVNLGPAEKYEWWHGTGRITRIFSQRFQGFLQYDQGLMDFDNEDADYIVYSPSIGFQYIVAEDTPMMFSIGYLYRDREVGASDDAFIFSGELRRWQFVKDAYLSFLAESGYNTDNVGAERLGFGLYYSAKALAEYLFTRNWTGSIYSIFEKNEYTDFEERRDDTEVEFGSELIYSPSPTDWLSFHLKYAYRNMDSTFDEDDYKENRILLEVRLAPPNPYTIY